MRTIEEVSKFIIELVKDVDHNRFYHTIELPYRVSISGDADREETWKVIFSNVKFEGKKVLDIGCYHGYFSFKARQVGATKITGLDYDKKVLYYAEKINDLWGYNVKFLLKDMEKYKVTEKYDIVLCLNVINYFKNLKDIMDNLFSVGKIIIVETTKEYLKILKNIKTHKLVSVLSTSRTMDLKRMIYIYRRIEE